MIHSLRIVNYQSHTDSPLIFTQGVNVITGPSDAGKSSVVRSLKSVCLNRHSDDSYRRHKTKKTSVMLDGVEKVRTASKHFYQLGSDVYKALRTDVPQEVTAKLNVSDINFQEQHDAYFLIDDSPGQVAKTLNQVADLQIIDQSLKEIKSRVKESKTNIKYSTEQLSIQQLKMDEVMWALDADTLYTTIEEKQRIIKELHAQQTKLKEGIDAYEERKRNWLRFPNTDEDIQKIKETLLTCVPDTTLPEAVEKVIGLQVLTPDPAKDIILINSALTAGQQDFSQLRESYVRGLAEQVFVWHGMPKEIIDVSPMIAKLQKADYTELSDAVNEILIAEDCADFATSEFFEAEKVLDLKMQELDVCPLCGRGDQ